MIVADPVAPPNRLEDLRSLCDDIVCLLTPLDFWAIGQFYEDFSPVEDTEAVELVRENVAARSAFVAQALPSDAHVEETSD